MTTNTQEDLDLGIICTSDDPRRGARLKNTVRKEIEAGSSNRPPTREVAEDNTNADIHTLAGRELDDSMK